MIKLHSNRELTLGISSRSLGRDTLFDSSLELLGSILKVTGDSFAKYFINLTLLTQGDEENGAR